MSVGRVSEPEKRHPLFLETLHVDCGTKALECAAPLGLKQAQEKGVPAWPKTA
jgi:hypothetical protein